MHRYKTKPFLKKTSTRITLLVLGVGIGISLLVSGGTFAKWGAAISQMTGATIQIGDWFTADQPVISTDTPPEGRVGVEYRHQFEATNSEEANWSTKLRLPDGLSLSSDGVLSGIPTSADTFNLRIAVQNSTGSHERDFNLVIHPAAPVFDETQVLPDAYDGKRYSSVTLKASGVSKVYELTKGSLPNGLTLSSHGVISGTPVGYGTFTFTATVSNSAGSDTKDFTLNLNSDFPYVTTTSLPDATKGEAYNGYITGPGTSVTYAIVDGSLPSGLSLNATTGRIVGSATVRGLSNFTVSKTNTLGSDTKNLSIYVRYAAPTITTYSLPTVRKNVAYSQQINGVGEESVFAISEGRLPTGLSLDPATGLISGTTTELGDYKVTITRTNESGVATRSFEFQSRLAAPVITTDVGSSAPDAYLGTYYEMQNTATGEEIVWSATGLPDGITIDPITGLISGISNVKQGSYVYVTATNSGGSSIKSMLFSVRDPIPEILTTSMAAGEVGKAYSETFKASGTDVSIRIASGSLPPGIVFDHTTGILSGTPTKSGTYDVTFRASNNGGSVSQLIKLVIAMDAPTITTTSLEAGMQGISYSASIIGAGEASTYAITAGSLPSGLYFSNTGRVTGSPSASSHGPYTFTVTKTNSVGSVSKEFTINVVYQTPTLTSISINQGRLDTAYNMQLAGVGNGVTYTVTEGSLPKGITISNTGLISGTPTETGSFPFTLQKSNESGSVSRSYVFNIVHVAPRMLSTAYDRATIGVPYSMQIQAVGLDLVYSGGESLPEGLTLDANTGIISGTPTVAGSITVQISVTNSGGTANIRSSFYVNHVAPVMVTTSIPDGMVGEPYFARIETIGEGITYTSTSLPSGLRLDATTGVISGTPTSAATHDVTFYARNSGGSVHVRLIWKTNPQMPTITTESLPEGVIGTRFQHSLSGVGALSTFSITAGVLPPGINMGENNGNINGTPTTRGTYTFTVTKTNVSGTVSKEFTLKISHILPTLTIVDGPLKNAVIGQNYSLQMSGVGSGVTHSISKGELPPGLSLDPAAGRITGIPTDSGNYTFTIRKWNEDGEVSRDYSIAVPAAAMASLAIEPSDGLRLLRSTVGE